MIWRWDSYRRMITCQDIHLLVFIQAEAVVAASADKMIMNTLFLLR